MHQERATFGGRAAAIMALAGSAIGLGNIWRFPYMVGEYGGAAFILVYLACVLFVSIPIMLSESIIGRRAACAPTGAMRKLAPGTRWSYIGILATLAPLIIISYYSVVGGWSIGFFAKSAVGAFARMAPEATKEVFSQMTGTVWMPILCHTVFLILSAGIISFGVNKGIEKFSKMTVPVLFVMVVLIVIFSVSLPGAQAGIEYLVKPDFSKITPKTLAFALGQSFFSLSLGVGTVLTYSSYMKKNDSLLAVGSWTAVFDSLFALLAGFAIMPAVFAAGVEPGAGPSLVFETLPYIFTSMSSQNVAIGVVVTFLFFFTVLMAALSSEVSMYEVCVDYFIEEKKMSRLKSTILVFVIVWTVGVFAAVLPKFFSFCDVLTSNYLMMFGALAFSIFVGWKMKKEDVRDELNNKAFPVVYLLIKFVAPIAIVVIFLTNLLV